MLKRLGIFCCQGGPIYTWKRPAKRIHVPHHLAMRMEKKSDGLPPQLCCGIHEMYQLGKHLSRLKRPIDGFLFFKVSSKTSRCLGGSTKHNRFFGALFSWVFTGVFCSPYYKKGPHVTPFIAEYNGGQPWTNQLGWEPCGCHLFCFGQIHWEHRQQTRPVFFFPASLGGSSHDL